MVLNERFSKVNPSGTGLRSSTWIIWLTIFADICRDTIGAINALTSKPTNKLTLIIVIE